MEKPEVIFQGKSGRTRWRWWPLARVLAWRRCGLNGLGRVEAESLASLAHASHCCRAQISLLSLLSFVVIVVVVISL
jgi:hypothetical protein